MKLRRRIPVAERVLARPGGSFAMEQVVGPVLSCDYHAHSEYEITYVDGGFGTRLVGDNLSPFAEGDLVMIGGGIPHLYYNRAEDSLSPTWARSMVVKFRGDCLGPGFFDLPEMASVKGLLERSGRGLHFHSGAAQGAAKLIKSLFMEGRELKRMLYFLELLALLAEAEEVVPLSLCEPDCFPCAEADRVERVLKWLHKNSAKPIDLEDAARVACLAPGSFSRFFRKATRRRFIDYLGELRVANACRLLSGTGESIASIAIGSGYRNLSNFNRQFLKLQGMTPKAYRSMALSCFPKKYRRCRERAASVIAK